MILHAFKKRSMAKSKYEYVRSFEASDVLLPCTWIVIRIDGQAFHKFSEKHKFEKPNDIFALDLMNAAAASCMRAFSDIVLAYGQSDEFRLIRIIFTRFWRLILCLVLFLSLTQNCFSDAQANSYL